MLTKTLLLSEIFPPKTGGSGRWFWEIYRRLPRERYIVAAGEHPRQAEFDGEHSMHVHRLPLAMREWGILSPRGLAGYLRAVWKLHWLIRSQRVTRVHCGRCLPEGVMAWALKTVFGIPYLCYIHGEDINTARSSREHAYLVRRVLRHCDCCIANSHNTARLLRADWGIPSNRIQVLYPGVDTAKFSPVVPGMCGRDRLNWRNRTVVVTVGRLQQRKGQDMLIRALPAIRQRIPNVLYAIVGDGEDRARLRDMAEECGVSGHVDFRGETDDTELVDCYRHCDVFALPNRDVNGDIEGFGMVLLEAQACGKPVITGDSGGTAEAVQHGRSGRVVDCRQPATLADAVVDLLCDRDVRESMGQAGRKWVADNFSWDVLGQRAASFFAEWESGATHRVTLPEDSTPRASV